MSYSITKVAVLGAGVMGAGIAASVAGLGIPVALLDMVPFELTDEETSKGITKDSPLHMNRLAQAGKDRVTDKRSGVMYTPEMADYIAVGNFDTSLEMLRDCDWVIEVVAENVKIKQDLLTRIHPFLKKTAIVSTNTSGIPISDIAAGIPEDMKARFLGTHFFNPPRYMKLLEIIPGKDTDPNIVKFIEKFSYESLGKGVVVAKDTPNFIGNRIGVAASPVIMRLMDEYGYDFETVDYLTGTLIGVPRTATFALLDVIGLDVLASVNENILAVSTDQKEKELLTMPEYFRELVGNKQLGNKTRQGFYKRTKDEKGKRQTLVWSLDEKDYVAGKKVSIPFIEEAKKQKRLKDRLTTLVYSDEPEGKFLWDYLKQVIAYSAQCIPEIADSYEDVDKAMRWGYNWSVGPFEIWHLIGFEKASARMKEDGIILPAWVEKMLADSKPLYSSDPDMVSLAGDYKTIRAMEHSALLDMGNGVLGFEIKSPGSAISAKLREELIAALDEVENNPDHVGMVILSASKNFLNGANLFEIMEIIDRKDFAGLEAEVDDFHKLSLRFKYSKKPVVAAIHGNVLGGGMELSIHCSRIVAHLDTYMGLVEVGVGLIPGGGGCKELAMRTLNSLKPHRFNDLNPAIQKLWNGIANAAVSKNAFDAVAIGYMLPTDKIVMQIDLLPQRAKEEVLTMVKEGYRQKLAESARVTGISGYANIAQVADVMVNGKFVSEYDRVVSLEVAKALTGGNVPKNTVMTEAQLLALEKKGFVALCKNEKTYERIKGMMDTGRAVRN